MEAISRSNLNQFKKNYFVLNLKLKKHFGPIIQTFSESVSFYFLGRNTELNYDSSHMIWM